MAKYNYQKAFQDFQKKINPENKFSPDQKLNGQEIEKLMQSLDFIKKNNCCYVHPERQIKVTARPGITISFLVRTINSAFYMSASNKYFSKK